MEANLEAVLLGLLLLAGNAECNLSPLSGQTIGLERMDLEHVRKGSVERSYTGLHGVSWGIHAPPPHWRRAVKA